jgi:hypothetical protein
MSKSQLKFIRQQITKARTELSEYQPDDVDWYLRAKRTCNQLVPWMCANASGLSDYVEGVMNSPFVLRNDIAQLFDHAKGKKELCDNKSVRLKQTINSALDFEKLLLTEAGGTVVSKLIERFLIANSTDWVLESNGASDYPDLFSRSNDYTTLPAFKRGIGQVYGAAVKGQSRRPVRIPDGLEIKTCKGRFAVDCHHAHAGLHLVLLFDKEATAFRVTDIQIGFLRKELYRITVPSSPTTTLKASFNGDNFVSVLDARQDAAV